MQTPQLSLTSSFSLAFLSLAAISASSFGARAGEAQMDGPSLAAVFPGMTMTGNYGNGVKFTETYHPDGSIDYWDDVSSDTGRWFVRGNLFCTFYDLSEGACYSVRRSADNCYEYFTQENEAGNAHENAGNWNSVGWDRSKPTQCDLADKTS
jgi:hypothetical protein